MFIIMFIIETKDFKVYGIEVIQPRFTWLEVVFYEASALVPTFSAR